MITPKFMAGKRSTLVDCEAEVAKLTGVWNETVGGLRSGSGTVESTTGLVSKFCGNEFTARGLAVPKTVDEATDAMVTAFRGRQALRYEVRTLKERVVGA